MKQIKKYFELVIKHFDKLTVKVNFVLTWSYFIIALIITAVSALHDSSSFDITLMLLVSTFFTLGFLLIDYRNLLKLETELEDER